MRDAQKGGGEAQGLGFRVEHPRLVLAAGIRAESHRRRRLLQIDGKGTRYQVCSVSNAAESHRYRQLTVMGLDVLDIKIVCSVLNAV